LVHQRTATGWGGGIVSTTFRFYIGAVKNIIAVGEHANKLYLAIQNANGTMAQSNVVIDDSSAQIREIPMSGNHTTSLAYYEVFIYSANNEKIIVSSGYVGGQL